MSVLTVSRLSKPSSKPSLLLLLPVEDLMLRVLQGQVPRTPKRVSILNDLQSEYEKKENRQIGSARK